MLDNRIKFYILIPVYKTERYIRDCLDSICNQTYGNYCAIVVDDGSPDRAGEICDEYATKDSRFYVIHKSNQGLISARRAAIDYAKENLSQDAFFVFLDSDDKLHPDALQVLSDTICRDGCDVVIYGLQRVCNGEVISLIEPQPFVGIVTDKRELFKKVFGNSVYNPLCRKAVHCSCVPSLDYSAYYHVSRAEDLLQSIPIFDNCKKVSFISDVLYDYTVNPSSITRSVRYENFKVDSTVRAEVWKFIKAQQILSQEDKLQYIEFCREILKGELCTIACFQTSYSNISKLFDQVRADEYMSMLLSESRQFILWCVRNRLYWVLMVLLKTRQLASKFLRFLKSAS